MREREPGALFRRGQILQPVDAAAPVKIDRQSGNRNSEGIRGVFCIQQKNFFLFIKDNRHDFTR